MGWNSFCFGSRQRLFCPSGIQLNVAFLDRTAANVILVKVSFPDSEDMVIVYFFGILISFLVEIIKTKIKNIYYLYSKLPELTTYMYTNNHSRNIF